MSKYREKVGNGLEGDAEWIEGLGEALKRILGGGHPDDGEYGFRPSYEYDIKPTYG